MLIPIEFPVLVTHSKPSIHFGALSATTTALVQLNLSPKDWATAMESLQVPFEHRSKRVGHTSPSHCIHDESILSV